LTDTRLNRRMRIQKFILLIISGAASSLSDSENAVHFGNGANALWATIRLLQHVPSLQSNPLTRKGYSPNAVSVRRLIKQENLLESDFEQLAESLMGDKVIMPEKLIQQLLPLVFPASVPAFLVIRFIEHSSAERWQEKTLYARATMQGLLSSPSQGALGSHWDHRAEATVSYNPIGQYLLVQIIPGTIDSSTQVTTVLPGNYKLLALISMVDGEFNCMKASEWIENPSQPYLMLYSKNNRREN